MSIFIDTLKGQKTNPTPVWLMRQAGRHLPEYITIRKQFANLMDMFLDPLTILEVSLQPVNRYGMDACIVFSDILITPFAAGSSVSFIDGQGPVIKFNENMSYNLEKTLPLYNEAVNFISKLASKKKTILFVTHDFDEALKLADRIAIMKLSLIHI